MHGWVITTSGFRKGMSAILEFYFRFRVWPVLVIGMVILHRCIKLIEIGQRAAELWRHIDFSRWQPAAMLDFVWVISDHPQSTIAIESQFGLQIWSRSDVYFRRYCYLKILTFCFLPWNCLYITWLFPLRMHRINVKFNSVVETTHIWIHGVVLSIYHPTPKGVAFRIRCIYS